MDNLGDALFVTIALSALGIIVGLAAVIVRAVALQRSITRVATGALSREDALADSRKFGRNMLRVVALVAMGAPILTIAFPWESGSYVIDPHLWLGVFAIVNSLTLYAYSVLGAWMVSASGLRVLRGVFPTTAESVLPTLKAGLLNYLPFVLICVGLSLTFASGWALGVWLLCLIAVVWNAALHLFTGHLSRLIDPTRAVEFSAMQGLKDRVAHWSVRCGLNPPDVRVLATASLGAAYIAESGLVDRTLYISDYLLANTDWRQQDAFIVSALLSHKPVGKSVSFAIVLQVFTYGLIGVALTTPNASTDPATSSFIAVLLLLSSSVIGQLATRQGISPGSVSMASIDRFTAEITGDPLAVMVGMNTLATLNDTTRGIASNGTPLPPISNRMRALDVWMQQPGPRAPWAYQPVPSRWPVTVGTYLLTAPLESAPPPAPVPTAPYILPAPATFAPVAP